ncbi:MAG: cache domain-containing protein, partial [Amphritea sp.]|nr:cache domain-containing protein [Amphritea sp.]
QLNEEVITQATERLTSNVTAELSAVARAEANSIAQEMVNSTDVALSLKQVMESFIERGLTQSVSRADISDLTGDILAKNQSVAGTYIAWLPNKVDGSDSLFAGQADHTHESGQFAPYWSRAADGSMALRPLGIPASGESGSYSSDAWYLCPIQTKKTCLTEPYTWELQGKTVVGTSITAPVTVKGEVVGMAGVDIVLDYLTGLAQRTSDNL